MARTLFAIGSLRSSPNPRYALLGSAGWVARLFREQPTLELARSASTDLTTALSPNERLLQLYHPGPAT